MNETLFPELESASAEGAPASTKPEGIPRLVRPNRSQMELRPVDLESLLPMDHSARAVWDFVESLDVGVLESRIQSVEGKAGRPATDPRILLSLWLYATIEGVGSARALERLTQQHDAYRWICGGVSVNYHTLSDFRSGQGAFLDDLLTQSVAVLMSQGLVTLQRVAQDGIRVRANAGAASFRREARLEQCLQEAQEQIERLRQELESDPEATNRRQAAARQRAAQERKRRVQEALAQMPEAAAKKPKEKKDQARVSTTDADARVMKMADGGFRPAYNCQISTVAGGQIVIVPGVKTVGSDRGLARPMLEEINRRHGKWPKRYLIDGGFNKNEDTEWAAGHGIKIYGPASHSKHRRDPYEPHDKDGPGVAAWRARMKSPHGKSVYKRRAQAECINARFRNWGLQRLSVRGLRKVQTVLRWFALTNNILQGYRLLQAAA